MDEYVPDKKPIKRIVANERMVMPPNNSRHKHTANVVADVCRDLAKV